MRVFNACVLLLTCISCRAARLGPYDTSATRDDDATASKNRLQIHIVPHSHDDAGWLKTVDQYYYGLRQDIQPAGVQYTLDTIVMSLAANPDRRFTFAEMAFFERWWNQQDEDTQSLVTKFVKEGRLNFVNGGYVQHDEAAAHYIAMVDQTTRGHRFLKENFNIAPTIGWQIDPFGHSSIQAGLLGPSLGFDAMFFGRADYQDMKKRSNEKTLEHLWRGTGSSCSSSSSSSSSDDTTDSESTLFTGNFPSGNYGPPPGFWWEWTSSPDAIIADDPDLKEYNVEERVNTFVQRCYDLANVTRGNDIMLTMGSDFHYSNAHVWYKNLDKLIHYVNKDGRVNVFYSSPEDYVAAKYSYNTTWPVKYDDFFPYADTPHSYWTGYFSSRAASKGYIRLATSYLQAARQLEAYVGRGAEDQSSSDIDSSRHITSSSSKNNPNNNPSYSTFKSTTEALEEAVSLCQHHDSITGTAKQHVANDYHSRIYHGMEEAQKVVMHALSELVSGSRGEQPQGSGTNATRRKLQMTSTSPSSTFSSSSDDASLHVSNNGINALYDKNSNNDYSPVRLEGCFLLNISTCAPTVDLSRVGAAIFLVAYNPLAWSRETPIRVPVSTGSTCHWKVFGPEGDEIPSQLVPIADSTQSVQSMLATVNATDPVAAGDAEIVFLGDLPPLGYSSYILKPGEDKKEELKSVSQLSAMHVTPADEDTDHVSITNGLLTVTFNRSSGLMSSISINNTSSNDDSSGGGRGGREISTIQISSSLRWYNASDGLDSDEDRGQSSGPYIFRPSRGSSDYPITKEERNPSGGKEENEKESSLFCIGSSILSRFFSLRRGLFRSCLNKNSDVAASDEPSPVAKLQVIKGEEVSEVRQVFDDWGTLITRVYKGQRYVEVEWTVGPIPFEDGLGREVILRYASDIQNTQGNFFTDANGRAMIERKLNTRGTWDLNITEEIAGNYYPITASAYIQDKNMRFAVLTDRAQGGASLRQGEIEFMVHRRNLVDDRRGVHEPLNETMCGCVKCDCAGLVVRGAHWLVLSEVQQSESDSNSGAVPRRQLQQLMNDPPVLAFGHVPQSYEFFNSNENDGSVSAEESTNDTPFFKLQRSFSLTNGRILHKGAHLMTLMRTSARTLLVRVAHLLDQGEEEIISSTAAEAEGKQSSGTGAGASVGGALMEDLGALLAQFQCSGKPEELTLSGNQLKRDSERRRLKFKPGRSMNLEKETPLKANEEEEKERTSSLGVVKDEGDVNSDEGSWLVHLKPMEVRIYEIDC
jgi:alpha-mannosidase